MAQASRKTLNQEFLVDRKTVIDDTWLRRLLAVLEARIGGIENKATDFDEAVALLLQVGLERVTEVLIPALEQVRDLTSLGFLIAHSNTPATLTLGATTVFTIPEGPERDLFTPSAFVSLSRDANIDDWAVLRTVEYDVEHGEYTGTFESVSGGGGPYSDWTLGALAGSTTAQLGMLEMGSEVLEATLLAYSDIIARHENIEDRHDAIIAMNTLIAATKASLEAGLENYGKSWWGARNTPPPTGAGNAQVGAQYLDTAITPNAVKVLTTDGWAPTVTTSLGGLRNQDYAQAVYASGVEFLVAGGFTAGDVLINGVVQRAGLDATLTPGASGKFTIPRAIAADEVVSFRGYAANDVTDYPTKADADAKYATKNNAELTGIPTAPTQAPGDSSTRIATTGFVNAALAALRGSVSSAWDTLEELAAGIAANTTALGQKLALAGGVLTGNLTITKSAPFYILNKVIGSTSAFAFDSDGKRRWNVESQGTPEPGGNVGGDFIIARFNDAGAYLSSPIVIARDTGVIYLLDGKLKFPGTQLASADPNTLDDYEEGTWFPTITNTSGNPAAGAFNDGCFYVKVGCLVHCRVRIRDEGSNADLVITLPFPSRTNDYSIGTYISHGGIMGEFFMSGADYVSLRQAVGVYRYGTFTYQSAN